MSSEYRPPYVVSADANTLLKDWTSTVGLGGPSSDFMHGLLDDLSSALKQYTGTEVIVIPEHDLIQSINERVAAMKIPVASFDRVYFDPTAAKHLAGHLDVTRLVNESFDDLGLFPRLGRPSISQQLDSIALCVQSFGSDRVALVDDVVFAGDGVARLSDEFKKRGITVDSVIAGIAIKGGVDKIGKLGIQTHTDHIFEEVVDEVCERDFRPGIPFSGRSVLDANGDCYSAPYVIPFGDPIKWASIPQENAQDFSRFCLQAAIALWSKIEDEAKSTVQIGKLPRKLQFNGIAEEVSIVRALRDITHLT